MRVRVNQVKMTEKWGEFEEKWDLNRVIQCIISLM